MKSLNLQSIGQLVIAAILGSALTLGGAWWWFSQNQTDRGVNKNETVTLTEDSAIIETVKKVSPTVVSIVSSQNVRSIFGGLVEQKEAGTGFIVESDGLIVTNKHVVSSDQAKYQVLTANGKSYEAEIVARDPLADLAMVRIKASNLAVVELGDSDKLELGQRVVAIGNALGEYQNTVTTGVISGIGRTINAINAQGQSEKLDGVIQTDAAINPGNSGGPLVNLAGQVIGINVAIDSQGQAVGFALPINSVRTAIKAVIAKGEIVRPKLGLRYIQITKEFAALNKMDIAEGVLVARGNTAAEVAVQPGGPADLAGIKEGDIIVSIGSQKITDTTSIPSILQKYTPGESVEIEYIREGKTKKVNLRLGKL
ncbi:MAG: trypsin-like peptidase domain-containing protein [bacterium]